MDKIITIKSVVCDMRFDSCVCIESNPFYLRVSSRTYKRKKNYDPYERERRLFAGLCAHECQTICYCSEFCGCKMRCGYSPCCRNQSPCGRPTLYKSTSPCKCSTLCKNTNHCRCNTRCVKRKIF